MKKRHERSVTIKGQGNKSSLKRHALQSRQLLSRHHHVHNDRPANWYQMRKRANQRLRALSNGRIILVNDPRFPQMYHGHHIRHWLEDTLTEHKFLASVREVALVGADKINPFTNYPIDLNHYGSLGAVQEHVHGLSMGNIEFLADNELGGVSDVYEMACLVHQCRLAVVFSEFLAAPLDICPYCNF